MSKSCVNLQLDNTITTDLITDKPDLRKKHNIRKSMIGRESWDRKIEFLLAIIGFSVDLGNVWRFPSTVFQSGGGAFFVPYFIMLILVGFPLFYLELVLGQYHRNGVFTVWRYVCPLVKGIGASTMLINFMMGMYYNTIISWAVFYLFSSFRKELPWKRCTHSWNSRCCLDADVKIYTRERIPFDEDFPSLLRQNNCTKKVVQAVTPENGFYHLGKVKWDLCMCLLLVFVVTYFALWKGVKSSGKIVWVTAIAPYIILFILLIRGVTLHGAHIGILFYLKPNMRLLRSFKIWNDAATQICFSLGPGFGTLLALSSYNRLNNNCYRDALLTSIINCMTSILSGFVVFSTLGHMAKISNTTVLDVIQDKGSEIVFIVYPHAVALMKGSVFWAILFFFMLITLGIDSTFAGLESIITGLCDQFPKLCRKHREIFVLIVVSICFLGAIPTCTSGGPFLIDLMNELSVSPAILVVLLTECVAVSWSYVKYNCYNSFGGVFDWNRNYSVSGSKSKQRTATPAPQPKLGIKRLSVDIEKMIGRKPGLILKATWLIISPIILCSMISSQVNALITDSVKIRGVRISQMPKITRLMAYLMVITPIMMIPIFGVIKIYQTKGADIEEKIAKALIPKKHEAERSEDKNTSDL